MPSSGPEGQFRFLISCIRYSNNGKVDFTEVAKECNIVSKGAAAKRYERMMKAHGIHQTQTPIRDVPISSRKPKDETSSTSAKKRKLEQFEDGSNTAVDDDEVGFSSSSKIKDEGIITIKDEIDFSGYGTDWLTFSDSGAKTEFDPTLLHDGLSLEDCFQVEGFGAVDDQVLYDDGIPKEGGGHGDGGMRMMSDDQSGCHESITILD